MLREDEAAESGNGGQSRDENGFSGASSEDVGGLFLGEAIEDVNAVSDPNPDDERQGHNVGRIKGNVEKPHNPAQPKKSHSDWNQGQGKGKWTAKMNEDQQRNSSQGIICSLNITAP